MLVPWVYRSLRVHSPTVRVGVGGCDGSGSGVAFGTRPAARQDAPVGTRLGWLVSHRVRVVPLARPPMVFWKPGAPYGYSCVPYHNCNRDHYAPQEFHRSCWKALSGCDWHLPTQPAPPTCALEQPRTQHKSPCTPRPPALSFLLPQPFDSILGFRQQGRIVGGFQPARPLPQHSSSPMHSMGAQKPHRALCTNTRILAGI